MSRKFGKPVFVSFRLEDYLYELPPDRIAQAPLEERDASRLMTLTREEGRFAHRRFLDLPECLRPGDLLIANDTKVIPARLEGKRLLPGPDGVEVEGGKVEFLLLEERAPLVWEGAFHAAAKHKPGVRFRIPTPDGKGLIGELTRGANESESGTVEARFDRDPVSSGAGSIPLPHYIERAVAPSDLERYQTLHAAVPGSAAAPTAGLHFTERVRKSLASRGVEWATITLHVGLGTFRPVKAADIREHVMHEERFTIPDATAAAIESARARGGRVIAVGTTAVRALESAWDGARLERGSGRTKLFLHPGGRLPRLVDGLVTNFHLPGSTLLMLVSAFAGREATLAAYEAAVREKYRFYSYGDAMLVL